MADNVVANAGSGGATFATDDVSGVHYPLSKLAHGALDSATVVSTSSGLPVQQQGTWTVAAHAVTNAGTFAVQESGGALTALQLIDDAVATDGAAAPTKGLMLAGTDGTNAQTVKVDTAGELQIDVLTLPNVTVGAALPAGTNNIGDVDVLTIAAGDNNIGNVDVVTLPALVAGTANIGDVDVVTLPAIPTGTNSIGRVNPEPQTANGLSISRTLSAASTNATSVKASAGQVYSIYAHSINAAVRYLKLYNKASAPTVGTDTPVLTLPIPGNTAGAGFALDTGGMGVAFATGIALALTTGIADADTGAVAANEIVVNVLFK